MRSASADLHPFLASHTETAALHAGAEAAKTALQASLPLVFAVGAGGGQWSPFPEPSTRPPGKNASKTPPPDLRSHLQLMAAAGAAGSLP